MLLKMVDFPTYFIFIHQNQLISSMATELILRRTASVPLALMIPFGYYENYMTREIFLLFKHDLHRTPPIQHHGQYVVLYSF